MTVIAATDNHSLPPFASLALVPSLPPGTGGTGGVTGVGCRRRRSSWPQRSVRKEGEWGRVTFYFEGKGEEEDSSSESDHNLDSSEDEWGGIKRRR